MLCELHAVHLLWAAEHDSWDIQVLVNYLLELLSVKGQHFFMFLLADMKENSLLSFCHILVLIIFLNCGDSVCMFVKIRQSYLCA